MPYIPITDVEVLLILWIPVCIAGIAVAMQSMLRAAGDKAFLRALGINSIREALVDVNFSEALSHFVFKFVYGSAGLWALALRAQVSTPLTQTGWIIFLTLFLPILWLTLTDAYNMRRKNRIVQTFVRDAVEYVKVKSYLPDNPPVPVENKQAIL